MSTVIDPPVGHSTESVSPSRQLRTSMAAVRLSMTSLGVRKSLNREQISQAASTFNAEGDYVSAAKKLLDTRHPAYKAVTGVRNRAVSYWKGMSLPFPESGVRLIRQDDVDVFDEHMQSLKAELEAAVEELDWRYADLRNAAQQRLGVLYDPSDYPATLCGLFDITWDFPTWEPPDYLRQLNPRLYEEACQRVQARFNEAVQLAEQAFMEELASLVEHLAERISGDADGRPKVFRDSVVTNLSEFFDRFSRLNINSNEQLDELVANAQHIVRGVQPQLLRDNQGLRRHVAEQLSGVQNTLDELLVDRPRRNILRRPR
jgi:hypothetical protein